MQQPLKKSFSNNNNENDNNNTPIQLTMQRLLNITIKVYQPFAIEKNLMIFINTQTSALKQTVICRYIFDKVNFRHAVNVPKKRIE